MQFIANGVRLAFAKKIFQAKLGRVHPEFLGKDIGMTIDRECRRHRAGAAIVTAGHGIGVDLQKFDIGVIDAILTAGVMPGGERTVGFERAVAAAGVGRAHFARDDPAIALHAAFDRDHRRMSWIARG